MTAGYVRTFGVGVCRGRYAEALVDRWQAWDALHDSENDPVADFGADQMYVVFVVANGGEDLEHFQVHSLKEAHSILLQVRLMLILVGLGFNVVVPGIYGGCATSFLQARPVHFRGFVQES